MHEAVVEIPATRVSVISVTQKRVLPGNETRHGRETRLTVSISHPDIQSNCTVDKQLVSGEIGDSDPGPGT